MEAQIIDNNTSNMVSKLSEGIEQSSDIRMAVAFVSERGLAVLDPAIEAALTRGASIEFLIGLDLQTTEPAAVQRLYDSSTQNEDVHVYCFASTERASVYHPKLYLLRHERDVTAIIGSSNLTEGGLKRNVEVNVALYGSIDDEVITQAYASYSQLKFHTNRVIPDQEFINLYAELCSTEKKESRRALRDPVIQRLRSAYKEKAKQLRRPVPTRRDLVGGWLELVYDTLPDGEFTNEQAYANEKLYQQRFPGNRNIKAKIRQQLQYLVKMQLIEHLGVGRWKKV